MKKHVMVLSISTALLSLTGCQINFPDNNSSSLIPSVTPAVTATPINFVPLPYNSQWNLNSDSWTTIGPFKSEHEVVVEVSGVGDADVYLKNGTALTQNSFDCVDNTPHVLPKTCSLVGDSVYLSVYAHQNSQLNVSVVDGNWVEPTVIFKNLDPQTSGAKLFLEQFPDPEAHMRETAVNVAKILYKNPINSEKFKQLTFELRATDFAGNPFVAYKFSDGPQSITIVLSTEHLYNEYTKSARNLDAIRDEVNGVLYHELTHGYNDSPNTLDTYQEGKVFWAYTEGLADAVRIGAGFHKTKTPNANHSKKWLAGYETTGFFLHFIRQEYNPEFLYLFNKSSANNYGEYWTFDGAFNEILGFGVEEAWNRYNEFLSNGNKLVY